MKQRLEELALEKKKLLEERELMGPREYIQSLDLEKKDVPFYVHFRSLEYDGGPCTSCDY